MTTYPGVAPRTMVVDLEYCFTIVALLLVTGSFTPVFYVLLGDQSDSYTDSNPLKLATGIAVYLFAALLLLRHPGALIRTALDTPVIFAVLLLPLVSIAWSVDPSATLKRAVAHGLTVVFCMYIMTRIPQEKLLERLMLVCFLGGVASFLYALALPSQGITQSFPNQGSWEGIYGHKNELGRMASIAMLLCMSFSPSSRLLQKVRWATIAIFVFLLFMSQSRTNWVICFTGLCLLPVLRILEERRIAKWVRLLVLFLAIASIVFAATVGQDIILESLGRDSTLSGRESMWRGVHDIVAARYWPLGAGYGAFFTTNGAVDALATDYLEYWSKVPNHAHSGYWNTWADMCVPGELVLVIVLVQSLVRITRKVMNEPGRRVWTTWMLMLVLFLINNYSESVAFKHTDIAWVLLLLGLLYSGQHKSVAQRRPEREFRPAAMGPAALESHPARG
jgi:O-antigen ligase